MTVFEVSYALKASLYFRNDSPYMMKRERWRFDAPMLTSGLLLYRNAGTPELIVSSTYGTTEVIVVLKL